MKALTPFNAAPDPALKPPPISLANYGHQHQPPGGCLKLSPNFAHDSTRNRCLSSTEHTSHGSVVASRHAYIQPSPTPNARTSIDVRLECISPTHVRAHLKVDWLLRTIKQEKQWQTPNAGRYALLSAHACLWCFANFLSIPNDIGVLMYSTIGWV